MSPSIRVLLITLIWAASVFPHFDHGLNHTLSFGQWHARRSDCLLVLNLGLKKPYTLFLAILYLCPQPERIFPALPACSTKIRNKWSPAAQVTHRPPVGSKATLASEAWSQSRCTNSKSAFRCKSTNKWFLVYAFESRVVCYEAIANWYAEQLNR